MQDIAGARMVVGDIQQQDDVVAAVLATCPGARVDDLRNAPHHGYRAVHIIIRDPNPVEIQIRTGPQNDWAQICERLADVHGIEVKYGGGEPDLLKILDDLRVVTQGIDELKEEMRLVPGAAESREDRLAAIEGLLRDLSPRLARALEPAGTQRPQPG